MAVSAETPVELVEQVYGPWPQRADAFRRVAGRPITLAEKVLANHLTTPLDEAPTRARSYVDFSPDRVAMQDATAQMALLQFMTAGLPQVAVPTTVHCDHLIQARSEGRIDLATAIDTSAEVYDFLESVS